MQKHTLHLLTPFLFFFTLFNSACAQNPPAAAIAYLDEERLAMQSTVLLNNESRMIPLQNLEELKVASINFSNTYSAVFDSLLNKYTRVTQFKGVDYLGPKNIAALTQDLKFYNTLVIQVTDVDLKNQKITEFIRANQQLKKVVLAVFGNGNALATLNDHTGPILWTEKVTTVTASVAAQAIFGGVALTQNLPRTFSAKYAVNTGFSTIKTRLQYTIPEAAGINSKNLTEIDDIAAEAIRQHATPGCVVLVAKDGKVIFNKAYGYHTYEAEAPEKVSDIFDLASVTKISATTIEAMKLVEEGKLSLDSTMGSYLSVAQNTNKTTITVRELMLHQAGLVPYIPFHDMIKPADHSADSSAAYPTKVSDGYYVRAGFYKDFMLPVMLKSHLNVRGKYEYSDLSMYFMKEIIESVTAEPLNLYMQQNFYDKLGMQTAGFLPRNRFTVDQIVPTENDTYFRHTLLRGFVHDQGAALAGGVSGHAGLFASANDLAILFQMLLNKGTYGDKQYLQAATIDSFTVKQSNVSRRGLGFDRWDPLTSRHYPSELASDQTYGHTGYTGTCVWVDPKYNLVYIFLSNRVHPKVTEKLSSLRIRPRIQDVVYKAIEKGL
ncbi:beta-N-acetylglucosaminidase [Mucilaginibacter limnophilus]|uniref:Beta-N-acetylglucosaminidase n=1 Tax=Mucilaginibacter limnophilus TaxID=1932778 RepID=A0A3S2ULK8_9SPHI|nr:serine hydrolase [Mucilaginibacter limnophilus]RVU01257.1 beta-N-acetylglucosaminidase [Mucilaginibacter limnophilus]